MHTDNVKCLQVLNLQEFLMLEFVPDGYDQIIEVYGDPFAKDFARQLELFLFPYPLLYLGREVLRGYAHRLAVPHFQAALELVLARGLREQVVNYAGIYAKRSKRGQVGYISTHSWGIAIDLEAERFGLGSTERFSPEVCSCFYEVGFTYGGDFDGRKDPMHWQLCSGY